MECFEVGITGGNDTDLQECIEQFAVVYIRFVLQQ